ncbi:LacI family DNA-binding transcriptional regulator [Ruficoccus amylovorans]|uniref:LacI family DNA-binding transcriptional regulator n=1 Tax=Ruficoccus amylovorans TaxID=1804625 RepID=A0A842HK57_9BACT|nr:LacI family DNA-binding transcriptional regulator [Ruficoccus amylovorans]MBC2595867.1 LacI family DNA-binding transcriptional regulator [Ruficoccus amylovorans]
MAKLQDIAKLADVSAATVSRVFNHHPNISLEVRKRVFAVAREHGYRPRLSLKQKNVVVITPYDPVYPVHSCVEMIMMALVQEMSHRGFRLEILPENNRDRLDGIQFCAAVAIGAESSLFHDWSERYAIPLVIMDRDGDTSSEVFYVRSDETQGMRLAIEHLHEHGCRKVGSIVHGSPGTGNTDLRHDGVKKALAACGLPADETLTTFSGPGTDKYVELIGKLLKQNIDALFCPGGNAGVVSFYAFSLYNRQVPADISLIASEQTLFSQYAVPPLTTITPDYQAMAAATADVIEARIESREMPAKTVLPYSLLARESVKQRH